MKSLIKQSLILAVAAFVGKALSKPPPLNSTNPYITWKDESSKPVLELPYGKFEATEKNGTTWNFKNIPYAKPPVGDLRWKKPVPPEPQGFQPGDRRGDGCYQVGLDGIRVDMDGVGPLVRAANSIVCTREDYFECGSQSEDCLFLDISVPERALKKPQLKLPVVVFIYGGSFVDGRKDYSRPLVPLYDGTGLVEQSKGEIIYITFNYRVGIFGFLAGKTMEEQGVPNAGLWDQRAVFQWVQDHILKIGGDPNQVTAMGHSGGAASILFHLTAEGGTLDPLFRQVVLLSPAYVPMWDRAGLVEDKFQRFAQLVGCEGQGLDCIRKNNGSVLQGANVALAKIETKGNFPVGPTPDGTFIRQLPVVELEAGNVWPIQNLILSHVANEMENFINEDIRRDEDFNEFLGAILPKYAVNSSFIDRINEAYPPVTAPESVHRTQKHRISDFLRDSCVTCNIRWLVEALGEERVWLMRYNMPPSTHGWDLIPLFFQEHYDDNGLRRFLKSMICALPRLIFDGVIEGYKSHITSFIRTSNPNVYRRKWWQAFPAMPTKFWRHPALVGKEGVEHMDHVLEVHSSIYGYFDHVLDGEMPKSKCSFWKSFYIDATIGGDYSPVAEVRKLTSHIKEEESEEE